MSGAWRERGRGEEAADRDRHRRRNNRCLRSQVRGYSNSNGTECYRVLISSRLEVELWWQLGGSGQRQHRLVLVDRQGDQQVTSEPLTAQHSHYNTLDSRAGNTAYAAICVTVARYTCSVKHASALVNARAFTRVRDSPAVQCQLARNREPQSQHEGVNARRSRVHSR